MHLAAISLSIFSLSFSLSRHCGPQFVAQPRTLVLHRLLPSDGTRTLLRLALPRFIMVGTTFVVRDTLCPGSLCLKKIELGAGAPFQLPYWPLTGLGLVSRKPVQKLMAVRFSLVSRLYRLFTWLIDKLIYLKTRCCNCLHKVLQLVREWSTSVVCWPFHFWGQAMTKLSKLDFRVLDVRSQHWSCFS